WKSRTSNKFSVGQISLSVLLIIYSVVYLNIHPQVAKIFIPRCEAPCILKFHPDTKTLATQHVIIKIYKRKWKLYLVKIWFTLVKNKS
ncbi:unnamed protein product, partial [Allacma fusca]